MSVLDEERRIARLVDQAQRDLVAAVREVVRVHGDGTESTKVLAAALATLDAHRAALRHAEDTREQRRAERVNGRTT